MNTKFKFLSAIVLVCLLSMVTCFALADGLELTLTVVDPQEYYEPGDEFDVEIGIINPDTATYPVADLSGVVVFSGDYLEVTMVDSEKIVVGKNGNKDIKINAGQEFNDLMFLLSVPNSSCAIPSATIGTISFIVKDEATGTAGLAVSATANNYYELDGNNQLIGELINYPVQEGSLTISFDKPAAGPVKPELSVEGATYDGTEKTAVVTGFDSETMNIENNVQTNAGTYTISVTSKTGMWADESTDAVTVQWTIAKASCTKPTIDGESNFTYDGTEKGIEVIGFNGNYMSIVGYQRATEINDYTVTISFTNNNYQWDDGSTDPVVLNWSISDVPKTPITAGDVTVEASVAYDEEGAEPEVTVSVNGTTLTKDTDYTVTYANNTAVGTGTATITGIGAYTTETPIVVEFTITAKAITPTIDDIAAVAYNGQAQTPELTVRDGETVLLASDYDAEYTNNTAVGTASVTVTMKGNYTGTKTAEFTISKASLTPSFAIANKEYDGTTDATVNSVSFSGLVGSEALTGGTDYEVSAAFDTASVGTGKTVQITMNLIETDVTKNYELAGAPYSASANITAKALPTASLEDDSFEYTGSALTPTVTVEGCTSGTDYTVAYDANTNVGTATVTVTGTGNYTGTQNLSFTITAKAITPIVGEISAVTYNGEAQTPAVTVSAESATLVLDTDYTVEYSNNTNASTSAKATVKAVSGGNYTFSDVEATFTINPYELQDGDVALEKTSYIYTGAAIEPVVTVTALGGTLTKDTDYSVGYSDNVEKSANAKVTVTGSGNYTGTVEKTFTIQDKLEQTVAPFANATVTKTYLDDDFTITTTISEGDGTLEYSVPNTDVASVNATTGEVSINAAGTVVITATATETDEYAGGATATYTLVVNKRPLRVEAIGQNKVYDGTDDAEVSLGFNTPAGSDEITDSELTITSAKFSDANVGDGKQITVVLSLSDSVTNYELENSTVYCEANITPAPLPEALIDTATTEYTGSEITPEVTVDGLTAGTDFTVSYSGNTNVGEATVTVTGTGNYTGTQYLGFTITPKAVTPTVDEIAAVTYNGKAQEPTLVVRADGNTLVLDTDYTVAYSNNTNAGTATATVTLTGNYTGSATADFTINKATTTIKLQNLSQRVGSVKEVTYKANPAITDGTVTIEYEVDGAYGTTLPSEKGTYNVKATLTGDTNLEDTEVTATLTIKSKSSGGAASSGSSSSSSGTYAISAKVTNGTISPDGSQKVKKGADLTYTFEPDMGCQLADVIVDGKSVGKVDSYTFKNVTEKHTIEVKFESTISDWAEKEMKEADEKGLIPETFENKNFNKSISRGDFAAVAVKLYEALSGKKAEIAKTNPFKDTKDSYVLKAYNLGITFGVAEDEFGNGEITREQMATMLTRAIKIAGFDVSVDLDGVAKFADDADLSDWGKDSVYFMAVKQIINGVGNNKFDVFGNATIEQAIAIALRAVNTLSK